MIGEKIRELRELNNIGSRELSRLVGVAETYVSQLERGLIKNPDEKILIDILENIGLKNEELDVVLDMYNVTKQDSIGMKIKEVREQKGIGSVQLSRLIGKGDAYINQIEKGRNKNPDYDILHKIFTILDINDEEIYGILSEYNIYKYDTSKQLIVDDISNSLLTSNMLEKKMKNDAQKVYDLIKSLPSITQQFLFDMLDSDKS